MSPSSWRASTERILRDLSASNPAYRLAVLGVGNPDNGDDRAGPEVIRLLKQAGLPEERVLLVDGGPAPENVTGPIRRFKPDLLLIVDAAWMDLPPGSIELLSEDQIGGAGVSTHGMPLSMPSGYLKEETGCQVALLAIQPATTEWGQPMGQAVIQASNDISQHLKKLV